jgi:hypothetical protein
LNSSLKALRLAIHLQPAATMTGGGIGEKISVGVDKLLHKKHEKDAAHGKNTTGNTTGSGLGTTTPTGYGGTGTGTGTTGTGYGTTGTDSYSTGTTGTTGAAGTTAGQGTSLGSTQVTNAAGEVINRETFTKTHDNTTLLEKREYELQHQPVQQEYVVETKYVGDKALPGSTEYAGSETREVDHQRKELPRQDQTLVVENVDATTTGAGTTTGTTGTTGTGTTGY